MIKNKPTILAFVLVLVLSFFVGFNDVGGGKFLIYTVSIGIIFACFRTSEKFSRYLIGNFIYSFAYSAVCVFGRAIFLIIYNKEYTIDIYINSSFKVELELFVYLTLFFFVGILIGTPIKKSLVKHKDWFLTYKR